MINNRSTSHVYGDLTSGHPTRQPLPKTGSHLPKTASHLPKTASLL